jgi:hypothetical protein
LHDNNDNNNNNNNNNDKIPLHRYRSIAATHSNSIASNPNKPWRTVSTERKSAAHIPSESINFATRGPMLHPTNTTPARSTSPPNHITSLRAAVPDNHKASHNPTRSHREGVVIKHTTHTPSLRVASAAHPHTPSRLPATPQSCATSRRRTNVPPRTSGIRSTGARVAVLQRPCWVQVAGTNTTILAVTTSLLRRRRRDTRGGRLLAALLKIPADTSRRPDYPGCVWR